MKTSTSDVARQTTTEIGDEGGHRFFRFVRDRFGSAGSPSILVFDCQNRLHFELTYYAKVACVGVEKATVEVYLYAILPFFSFLENDPWQRRAGNTWKSEPEKIRNAVRDFLVKRLGCFVREHRRGFEMVARTKATRGNVPMLLSALKSCYQTLRKHRLYPYENPLVDPFSDTLIEVDSSLNNDGHPKMPEVSGIEVPRNKQRLTNNYFKFEEGEWVPQIIDDPNFPVHILAGGEKAGWKEREKVITRLLFDTGGRVFEILGLTLGDWFRRGLDCEATAFSKGSHGRRVKFFRFSSDTAKQLKMYFDGERRAYDAHGYKLKQYLEMAKGSSVDLDTIFIFLNVQGNQLTPKSFRDLYWNKACDEAGIDADVHQSRHWYVTMAVGHIYETSKNAAEVRQRLQMLVAYMKWKSGPEMLQTYEHHFNARRHAEVQSAIHEKLDGALKEYGKTGRAGSVGEGNIKQASQARLGNQNSTLFEDDADLQFLRSIGGHSD